MLRQSILIVAVIALMGLVLYGCGGEKADDSATEKAETPATNAPPPATGGDEAADLDPAAQLKAMAERLKVDLADVVKHESGLEYIVREEGTGPVPTEGQVIKAHYTGYLLDGQKFDSSVDRGKPFQTPVGVGRVIKGWDIAFTDMKVGEKRLLIIPSELGYGTRGAAGGRIPPNATLLFDVELLEIVELD